MTTTKIKYKFASANLVQCVAWMCLCQSCGDTGIKEIYDKDAPEHPYLAQCDTCNGTGREPMPWSELFRSGRLWVPEYFMDADDEEFDDEG